MPESTSTPPTCTAWPSMYLVVECTTMSAPHSNGRHSTGVANVLSTIRGTPCACASSANFSISNTAMAGFAMVSPNTAFVFGRKALCSSSSGALASTKVHSMPNFFRVTANRFTVPP